MVAGDEQSGPAVAGDDQAGPVAYFSMEVALDDAIPTYSGGLGVLAGDHLRAAADRGLPMVGVTLVYHQGFFRQGVDPDGRQFEEVEPWDPAASLDKVPATVAVWIGGRSVTVGAWRLVLQGDGGTVPVYFLDTDLAANEPSDRAITDRLYTGDPRQRLAQEAVLGIAGPALLFELGYRTIRRFHMNEGHAALVPVAVAAAEHVEVAALPEERHVSSLRRRCVFTTHTPVPAGHDRFALPVAEEVLGKELVDALSRVGAVEDGALNMTVLGMTFAGFVNGVAGRHGHVSQAMFPQFDVRSITNGVHVPTWAAPSTKGLLDRYAPGWRQDNILLRNLATAPLADVAAAHAEAKTVLVDEVLRRTGVALDPDGFTVGVARRFTPYKRNDMLLSDPQRLRALAERHGPLQVVYSGKSHPLDEPGKEMIHRVAQQAAQLAGAVRVVYLAGYGMSLAAQLVAGVDLWLNTPVAPHEASGTSGMKAAVNGVPSLSILDGWWVEGHLEGVTGWAIGPDAGEGGGHPVGDAEVDRVDADLLYRALDDVVLPLFRGHPDDFTRVRRWAMALNGSFFTTQRMVAEYALRAYGFGGRHRPVPLVQNPPADGPVPAQPGMSGGAAG